MQGLAERVESSRQQIHKLERGERQLTETWMRRLARPLSCEPAELLIESRPHGDNGASAEGGEVASDSDVTDARPISFDRRDPIPVYASAQGGPDGTILTYEPIEFADRPEPLFGVRNAFAMYVVNDSMEPKYSQGALLLVHPGRPVRRNDYVLVVKQSKDGEHSALVKQLVHIDSNRIVLRQFNPAHEFELSTDDIASVSLVIGSYESR